MPISRIPGEGLDTGSSGVAPSNLSTGAPSWDGSGNLSFNSGYGSNGVAYGCRAWVNFNGTTNVGGFCTVRASGNVTTVADNGTGDYTINFTTAMPDANYACITSSNYGSSNNFTVTAPTTTAARVTTYQTPNGGVQDQIWINVSIFR